MSLNNPFDPDSTLTGCSCGRHASQAEHELADAEALNRRVIQSTVMRALFPQDAERRRFLRTVGASTAWAAISSIIPFGTLEAMAQDKGSLEKKELKVGFIPITCASPLIMADPLGLYRREGLDVTLMKTAGWALIRDKVTNREYDASHMLAPMPLAMSLGVGSNPAPTNVMTIQNINGQAITLAMKHKDKRDPKDWKGFRFAIPFEFSMHNFLLRYYLAEHGLDPDTDVQLRVVPPPEMVANLRAGNIDGFLGPDPVNQRAVFDEAGFIHILSREIWDGHPCCSFAVPTEFIRQNPNTFAALYRAVLNAAAMARDAKNRPLMAEVLAPANYLNQPKAVLEQVLTGRFADGLGNVRNVPERVDYDPFPWYSMAYWILSQMKRWGYVKGDVRYKDIAEKVYLLTDARRHMAAVGMAAPRDNSRKAVIMGKEFDPARVEAYANSFAIRKA
ncbi:nitrate ABC transporter substrate-binding protein [Aromatoleum toluvorans]|uniref:Nitrate ABC transporter substrate-binding protein n=1 Tax=Aromatoleum toluvorans TaxID=92002 RepID=A0ABX1Q696_9RHOO|nr:CmpA/NrtA family ABC transporter substrate-binding protein [Aromatoleum toluvorans]NMG46286.1 nitrate ABC transporter substrate-binding protein [Aromatoleum toluvorans]